MTSPAREPFRTGSLARAISALASVPFCWCFCLASAAVLAWTARHAMNPDGLSYLDMASEALNGGPSRLVNGYWSPGYPALIALAFSLFHPAPAWEFPLIHLLNFLIFAFVLWAFSVFLRYWLRTAWDPGEPAVAAPFAYIAFLWFTLRFIGVSVVTPDLAVAGIVFLTAGLACRISLPVPRWTHYVALGAVLACGYYLKSPMFPLGLALLAFLFVLPPPAHRSRLKLLYSLAAFLLLSAPLMTALSLRAGKPTFGESGRLNYAWYADGLGWSGGLDVAGPNTTPDHPAPKLLTAPVVLEFASPVPGTYPLWYDPSYWYAAATARLDLRGQVAALKESLDSYKAIVFDSVAFVSGLAALCLFAFLDGRRPALPRGSWWLALWPLAAFAMYALVHVEGRFVGSFLILFLLPLYRALIRGVERRIALAVSATVLGTVMLPFLVHLAVDSAGIARDLARPRPPEYRIAANALTKLGLHAGDRLAAVGFAYNCYYARCARLRVVAQIPDSTQFWRLPAPEAKIVAERLASIGVKAIVAWNRPPDMPPAGWKDFAISDSARMSVLLLRH
jgi:hypothetical protein